MRCSFTDSTPSKPFRKCKREATGYVVHVINGQARPACDKHAEMFDPRKGGVWQSARDA